MLLREPGSIPAAAGLFLARKRQVRLAQLFRKPNAAAVVNFVAVTLEKSKDSYLGGVQGAPGSVRSLEKNYHATVSFIVTKLLLYIVLVVFQEVLGPRVVLGDDAEHEFSRAQPRDHGNQRDGETEHYVEYRHRARFPLKQHVKNEKSSD